MLQLAFGEPLVRLVPMVALPEVAQDVQHDLLVGVQLRIRVREQSLGIGGGDGRLLGERGRGGQRAAEPEQIAC